MTIDPNAFKEAMAHWASGVSVLTSAYDDIRVGITASAFNSVSLEPPRVLICISSHLFTHGIIEKSQAFALNVLGKAQLEWGKRFAGMLPHIVDRFDGIGFETAVSGSPLLPGVLCWLDCQLYNAYRVGDHTIFIGDVKATGVNHGEQPLLYYARDWHSLAKIATG